ncbi:ABC-type branched-chain amino acid transport system, ATPase component [Halanaeroarchaeum sp. HSR-CO]|uniref:ABC transporter ATP-binding protein n=1 Tax=Halanaeroarchaeum sp. HSR-CO TaxID=2866382 RepID=UPI00217EB545|nr:ABC transporter ATP-binding protein [Halanaeroarchaeum sp. HSR-CO]UWG46729.1 ABC-type branched-chain amino acid transport system, ATPase component [Halanaeroarchaeum sp. HSR-CO]
MLLDVEDLTAGYGDLEIVHDVSVTVDEGEYVALIGPNGAGKTTLLKSIFGFADRLSGSVRLRGEDIFQTDPEEIIRRGVSFVPQEENVFAPLSVKENLRMGAYTRDEIPEEILAEIYERFPRLEERTEQKAGTLSGGERKMLAVARALITEPDLLVLDEPSSGLAPNLVTELFDEIDAINAEGTAIFVVEQNAEEVLKRGDRGYVLTQGKIQMEDDCAALLDAPEVQENYLGG